MAELDNFEKQQSFCELDFRITSSDVETALKPLKKGAAPGVDGISAESLLAAKTYLMPLFVLMFNKVFISIFSSQYLKKETYVNLIIIEV